MIPIKSEREVEKMREACTSAARVLDKLALLVRPGVTTAELDRIDAQLAFEWISRPELGH